MRIYQQLENLFKLSIFSNEEIVPYLVKLTKNGKIDEPKERALLIIILDRLGKMEDEEEAAKEIATLAQNGQPATFGTAKEWLEWNGVEKTPDPALAKQVFPCPECGKVCKIKVALQSHMKTHKKVV